MDNDLYSAFFIDKPDLEIKFKLLSEKFNIPIERKLKALKKDKDEFLAAIIEFQFGSFFGSLFKNIQHERKIFIDSQFTPDWTITTENQEIVAEVIRLNPSKRDLEEMQFSEALIEKFSNISGDYVVQIKYKYDEIKNNELAEDNLIAKIDIWLKADRKVGESLQLDNMRIIVTHKNVGLTNIQAIGTFRTINFDYRRLDGDKSRLLSKLKYADAVIKQQLPYFICIHLSFDSGFDPHDMYKVLFGSGGIFYGDEPFDGYYPNAAFHTFTDGLFYRNDVVKNCVSGVIVYYNGNFTVFPNYCKTNRLSDDCKRILETFLYTDLKN
jgi:hypothetical protein